MKNLIVFFLLVPAISAHGQFGGMNRDNVWDASWVYVPGTGQSTPGLYLFRRTLSLESAPENFEVYVSADNRYKLYVNEKLVSVGPAWGDIQHWNYETVDLAPYLKAGENIIAAKVWNEGDLKAVAQFSYRTGFILQGATDETKVINTNETWKCTEDKSYTPLRQRVQGYYAAGAGEKTDMHLRVKGFEKGDFDDSGWEPAAPVFERSRGGMGFNTQGGWALQPSLIPPFELKPLRLVETRKAQGVQVPSSFPAKKTSIQIPAGKKAKILLDQTYLTNAYPTLIFSDGENSTIVITYAEGLYDENGAKNNRNEIEGKTISGRVDTIISDGSDMQNFTTLSWRTYRYVELSIETKDSPLVINDFFGTFTGYPFEMNASIESDDEELYTIMDIGWRTSRLCAVDTYMDCPYYERLQYVGDARIQIMISYYNSGDERLARNALNLWDQSRQPDGYTLSRYPDNLGQVIPTYSLWHVSALYDYLMHGRDRDFIQTKLLGSRQIMNYFISYMDDDGSLKNVPGWNFTDWVPDWSGGTGPMADDGSSALMDLQLLLALQSAMALEHNEGLPEFVDLYQNLARQLAQTIQDKYWDESKNLFADTPDRDKFSQHTNSLAILAGLVDSQKANEIAAIMLTDTTLAPASIYFKYYLHQALTVAGLGDYYLDWLDIWRKNIELGMSTWGEDSEVEITRSDCHAWGSSPNIEFFRILLGIESDAPYFEKVKIEPHLGSIEKISGEMPHPSGTISVNYEQSRHGLNAEITLPMAISGTFIWKGQVHELKGGRNEIQLGG